MSCVQATSSKLDWTFSLESRIKSVLMLEFTFIACYPIKNSVFKDTAYNRFNIMVDRQKILRFCSISKMGWDSITKIKVQMHLTWVFVSRFCE